MGLDVVEIILGIGEAFEIEIPDHEAEKLSTVGQLYAFVVSRLAFNESRRCPSSAVFYQARRALIDRYGLQRRSIAPATTMEALLPASRRRSDCYSDSR
jgi:hypothetical protein